MKFIKAINNPFQVRLQGQTYNINVMIRPGTEEFLERMGELYEVVVFTASLAEVNVGFDLKKLTSFSTLNLW